ncbi:HAD family phosphatase [Pseudonocardia sp. EV170527-09]|uniref:HAD family hydrolase n=1 Tax=Pseudonocardia sp. EV170527-09 TaxID=2603411 RepID=UPI0011F324D9|nr:HAD family hydrolase [Pseudonocardia sp. EV170527-09]KAA1010684.1 HAD family phosphatase [Pseudonocardia sp. EV170527-09]
MIRLVALDIDGTIVHGRRPPSPAVLDAIALAGTRAEVMLCTGRTVVGVAGALDAIGLRDGVPLTSNGAVEMETATRRVLTMERLAPEAVTAALDTMTELFPGAVFACEHVGVGQRVSAPFPDGVLAGTVTEVGRAGLLDEPTPKLVMYWPGHDPAETAARASRLRVPGTEPTLDHELPWVTLVPAGVSKASGLARVAARLGVDRSEVLAVGDVDNDRAMLRWAGRGIAMGQAPPDVHADADESTDTVEQDGLARALERVFG